MLPIRLRLKNFMSYGEEEQELDFSCFRLACISGNNGEGKSALLDAITWALWGVARGTDMAGRGADDLVRTGAEEAKVVFEFQIDEDLWQVERTRRRGRGGNVSLSRWAEGKSPTLHSRGDGAWQNSSGATPTLTQKYINSLLGLEYESFVNSAFLLQGRADEFSRQGASDRKKILGDILGLGVFENLCEQARAVARQAQTKADLLEAQISRLEEELAREPALQQSAKEAEEKLAQAKEQLEEARAKAKAQQERVAVLEEKQRQARELEQRLKKAAQQRSDLEKEREGLLRRLEECQHLLAREKEIEEGFAALQSCRRQQSMWGEKAAQFAALSEKKREHSLAIETERASLRSRAGWLKEQIQGLTAKSSDQELARKVEETRTQITALEARRKEAEELRESLRAEREGIVRLAERSRQLQDLWEKRQEVLSLLEGAEAACPVCRSKLSDARRQEVIDQLKKEGEELLAQARDCKEGIERAKASVNEQQTRSQQLDKESARLAELKQDLGRLENMLAQAQAAKEQLQAAQGELTTVADKLKADEFAGEARERLKAVEAQILTLAYDETAHRQSAERARSLAHFEKEKTGLEQARTIGSAQEENLARVRDTLRVLAEEIGTAQEEYSRIQAEATELPQARAAFQELSETSRRTEAQASELERRAAVAKNELGRLEDSRRLLTKSQKEKELAQEEAVVHTDLAAAYGKNGVQALIIETALPQLESFANELLGRLSEGGMRVSFHTQKERGDGVAETLEIRIQDENGERRYEMFSGGEAFRLNLAIRLALSKLLTQRAGARLSTLVIDEGFGSQDSEGRQRLVEAIHTVSADFDRILVITHLDELKAEFPHRVEVSKDESGSHIRQV